MILLPRKLAGNVQQCSELTDRGQVAIFRYSSYPWQAWWQAWWQAFGKPYGNLPGLEWASGKRENVLASRWQVIGYSSDSVQPHFGKRWMNDITIENETRV